MLSKSRIFVLLALIAAILGVLAAKNDPTFRGTVWSQVFWLTVGTLATTFLLNAILEKDLISRRRKQDQFAFRTFLATTMSSLLDLINADPVITNELMTSALIDNKKFARATQNARELISEAAMIQTNAYTSSYLDVASHLRDLANRFIRMFSSNEQEMVQHYQRLQRLARGWVYRDNFSERSQNYTNSLEHTNPEKQKREAELASEIAEVQALLKETAEYLAALTTRVAAKPGMPPAS
jgi:hypothetical protein